MKEVILDEQDSKDLMTCLSVINISKNMLDHTEGEENLSVQEAEDFYKGVMSMAAEARASLIGLKHDFMNKYGIPYYFMFKDGKVFYNDIDNYGDN